MTRPRVFVHTDHNPDAVQSFYEIPDAIARRIQPVDDSRTFAECLADLLTVPALRSCPLGRCGGPVDQVEMIPLAAVRAAVERVVEDLAKRAVWLSDDTVPTVMSWLDAHRLHGEEPYIGCPFCSDRFIERTVAGESWKSFSAHVNTAIAQGYARATTGRRMDVSPDSEASE